MSFAGKEKKVIVIVGPTGSGKTGVSIEIAKEIETRKIGGFLGAEIVSADSRTIYKGMNLGTAKPSVEERRGVSHFGFDLVEPGERFTVKDWKDYAEKKIKEIRERGKVPIIVGGTGLYIDALVYGYRFGGEDELTGFAQDVEIKAEVTEKDRGLNKKVVRDESGEYPDRKEMKSEYKIYGILWERNELRERLRRRANKLFVQELYDETERLVKKYGWENQAMKSNIYQFAWKFMTGEMSRAEAVGLNAIDDWHLAKRQMTWFKRNEKILWLPLEKIKPAVIKYLQDEQRK